MDLTTAQADISHVLHCSQVKLSPSGGRIAFTVRTDPGSEAARAYVRELPLGCALVWDLAELESVGTLEWLGEGHVLFTVPDAAGRPHQVPRRRITVPQCTANAMAWQTQVLRLQHWTGTCS
jgi:hypothetical protein